MNKIIRRKFIKTIVGVIPLCFISMPRTAIADSEPQSDKAKHETNDDILSLVLDGGCPVLTTAVTIKKARYNYFPNGRRYGDGKGRFIYEDSEQLDIECVADSFFDELVLNLFFHDKSSIPIDVIKKDLVEGSRWLVSGEYSHEEKNITLFNSTYRALMES